jgi:hypothetical protein
MLAKSDCLREPDKKKQRQDDHKPRPSLFWTEERPDKTYVRAVYILVQPDFVRLKERTEHLGYHSNSEKSQREEAKNNSFILSFEQRNIEGLDFHFDRARVQKAEEKEEIMRSIPCFFDRAKEKRQREIRPWKAYLSKEGTIAYLLCF